MQSISLDAKRLCIYIEQMKRRCVFMSDSLWESLRLLSKRTGFSISELIRKALDNYYKIGDEDGEG